MKSWREDQLQQLLSIQCEHDTFNMLLSLANELEFDYYTYGMRMPFPFSRPTTKVFNNYPVIWQTRYQEKNYIEIDPTVLHCLHSTLPVTWSDEVFMTARELWDDARSFGLHFGLAQSTCDLRGVAGMLTLARMNKPISDAEFQEKRLKINWLAHISHMSMSRFLCAHLLPDNGVKLSNREVDVLRWTAEGKTSGEISCILNISERTVNFHVSNAMTKLNAVNKTAAVMLAAVLGLLR